MPDAGATRSYRIVTPEGPRMLIAETYRRGMLMDRGMSAAQPTRCCSAAAPRSGIRARR